MDLINYLLPKIEHFQFIGYWIFLLVSLLESHAIAELLCPDTKPLNFYDVLFRSLIVRFI